MRVWCVLMGDYGEMNRATRNWVSMRNALQRRPTNQSLPGFVSVVTKPTNPGGKATDEAEKCETDVVKKKFQTFVLFSPQD